MIKTFKLLFFIIIIICIILGLWQIDRANEKANLYNSFKDKISKNPIDFKVIKDNPIEFTKIIIKGKYINDKQFLLDNKIFNKQAGYEVISPMLLDNQIILINRGWVSNNNRQSLPKIDIKNINEAAIGYIYQYKDFYQLSEDIYTNVCDGIYETCDERIRHMRQHSAKSYTFGSTTARTSDLWL